jgi:toxin FitB
MILLDTNIASILGNHRSTPKVESWFKSYNAEDLFVCAPVVFEISFGAEHSRLKHGQMHHLDKLDVLLEFFAGRILPFTTECALTAGRLRATRESIGRPVAAPDMMIAAIALHNKMTLATRNIRDFDGLDIQLVNPFDTV